jgi:hypothetical protein
VTSPPSSRLNAIAPGASLTQVQVWHAITVPQPTGTRRSCLPQAYAMKLHLGVPAQGTDVPAQ